MAAPKRSTPRKKPQATIEERQQLFQMVITIWDRTCTMVTTLGIVAGVSWCVYAICYLPLTVAPGETTAVTGIFRFVSDIGVRALLPWGVAGVSIYWGYRERRLRMRERKSKDERLREFELKFDSGVTTSGMNLSGSEEESKP